MQREVKAYTHELARLGELVGAPPEILLDVETLDPAFWLTRYPDPETALAPADLIDQPQARAHLAAAQRILEWAASGQG